MVFSCLLCVLFFFFFLSRWWPVPPALCSSISMLFSPQNLCFKLKPASMSVYTTSLTHEGVVCIYKVTQYSDREPH